MEIGDGNRHGGTLGWVRFQPGEEWVEFLSIQLDGGWRGFALLPAPRSHRPLAQRGVILCHPSELAGSPQRRSGGLTVGGPVLQTAGDCGNIGSAFLGPEVTPSIGKGLNRQFGDDSPPVRTSRPGPWSGLLPSRQPGATPGPLRLVGEAGRRPCFGFFPRESPGIPTRFWGKSAPPSNLRGAVELNGWLSGRSARLYRLGWWQGGLSMGSPDRLVLVNHFLAMV